MVSLSFFLWCIVFWITGDRLWCLFKRSSYSYFVFNLLSAASKVLYWCRSVKLEIYKKTESSTLKTTKKLKVYKTLKAGFQKLNKIFYGSSIDWRTRKPGGSSCFIDKLCFIRIRCIKFIMGEKNRRLPWAIKISLPTVCLSLQVFFLFLKDLALCLNT